MKKALPPKLQGLVYPGGAERDRTVGLLNAIHDTAAMEPEIPRKDGYPGPESGDRTRPRRAAGKTKTGQ